MEVQIPRVIYSDWGIASRIGNRIYMNKELVWNTELHDALLKHEEEHTSGFSVQDIVHDLKGEHIRGIKKQYYKFILQNPKTLVEFLPFWVYDKQLVINPLNLAVWGCGAIIIGGMGWFL